MVLSIGGKKRKVIENIVFLVLVGSMVQIGYNTYLDYKVLTFVYNLPVLKDMSLMILSKNVMISPVYLIFDNALSKLMELVYLVVVFLVFKVKVAILTLMYLGVCLIVLLGLSMLV